MGSVRFQRAVYLIISILTAIVGVLLVAAPGSTERLFAWALGPPGVAALTGGLFLGAAVAFALAAARARVAGRGFALLSIVFAGPVFGYTLLHRDLFDFGRWQALVWVVAFGLIILLSILMLSTGAWSSAGRGPMPATWARAILALLGLAGVAVATAMWVKSEGPRPWVPLELSQFAGQLFGMWFAVIGFACLWSAIRPAEEARVFVAGVTALLAGAAVGAIRAYDGFVPADRALFLGGLAIAFVLCVLVLVFQRAGAPAAER
jgi:hypothetical protein